MPQPSSHGGRHELGQDFLVDRAVVADVERLVAATEGPIVEIDPKRARRLDRRTGGNVTVVNDDILRFPLPRAPRTVVGNIPFHITTAVVRRLLSAPHWETAVLVVQWEVARRRAGVGGATMLTASWWPWYGFTVHSRIPARSFRPVPSVDGGLLVVTRRAAPLVVDREGYQRFVKQVFTGRGRELRGILAGTGRFSGGALRAWARTHRVAPDALPGT